MTLTKPVRWCGVLTDDELLSPPPPRERLSYTRYQLELLNGIFDAVRYPNSVQKQLIAKRVGISREQVKVGKRLLYVLLLSMLFFFIWCVIILLLTNSTFFLKNFIALLSITAALDLKCLDKRISRGIVLLND